MSFSLALFFSVLAAGQPQWGQSEQQVEHQPKRWIVCLDVSRSMLAQDYSAQDATTRLDAARDWIEQLCSLAGGDQMALIPFAGKARLMVPLTEDLVALGEMLALSSDRRLVGGGSDLGAALELALQTVTAAPEPLPTAVLILSDGEDWGQKTQQQVELCKQQDIVLNCVGFGSPLGSKIPFDGGFLQDQDGRDVVTALKVEALQQIASQTGGSFQTADGTQLALDRITLRQPKSTGANPLQAAAETGFTAANRFQWPLAVACLLWLLEMLTARRRRK